MNLIYCINKKIKNKQLCHNHSKNTGTILVNMGVGGAWNLLDNWGPTNQKSDENH